MAGSLTELTDAEFDNIVHNSAEPVLVDFWAPWCGPCKMQTPILEKVAAKVGVKAVIAKVNVDENPALAAQFGVRSIPTLILFKNGQKVRDFIGVQQENALVEILTA